MKFRPQFKLQSFFIVFICASIGLTCGLAPPPRVAPGFPGVYIPQFNWHYAFLSAASIAMLVGLIQQIVILRTWQVTSAPSNDDTILARRLAISWRLIIASLITICLAVQLLITRRVIELPENDVYFPFEVFPSSVWMLSMVVVLAEAIGRRTLPSEQREQSQAIVVGGWIAAAIFALIVLPQAALIHFLVHVATAGIESNITLAFQRHNAFPDHRAEGFRLFWLSASAAALIVIAAGSWFWAGQSRQGSRSTWLVWTFGFIAPLIASTVFCVWYFRSEFHRVSPDLAGAGFAANWVDLLGGTLLFIIVISSATLRLSADSNAAVAVEPADADVPQRFTFFHESAFCLGLIFAATAVYFSEMAMMISSFSGAIGTGVSLIDLVEYLFTETSNYLQLALILLSVRFAVLLWRQRGTSIEWRIAPIAVRRFIANWIALAILAVVAVATLSIYSFTFWLGPWYLVGS
ncbi:MAG: hypothetical protein AB7G28_25745 [Pirellulales bacterium]